MDDKLPFFIKQQPVADAIARGIMFEICYSGALKEEYTRAWLLKNAIQLVKATKGHNILISSGANEEIYHRTPVEVAQMYSLHLGLKYLALNTIKQENV